MKRQTSKYRRKRGWKNKLSMFLAMLLAATMAFGPVLNVYAETVSELIDVTENEPAETVDESTEEPDEPEPVVDVEPTGNEANPEPETEPELDPEDPEIDPELDPEDPEIDPELDPEDPEIDPELDPEDELEVEDEEPEDNEIEIEDNEDEIKDEDDEIEIKDDEDDAESEDEGDEEPTESPAAAPTKTFFGVAPTVVAAPAPATTTINGTITPNDGKGSEANLQLHELNLEAVKDYVSVVNVTLTDEDGNTWSGTLGVKNGNGYNTGDWYGIVDPHPASISDIDKNGKPFTLNIEVVWNNGASPAYLSSTDQSAFGGNVNSTGNFWVKYSPMQPPTPPHSCDWSYGITKRAELGAGKTNVTDNDTITYTITVTATCNGTVGTCDGTPGNVTLSDPMLWSDPKTVTETDWNGSGGAYTATYTETYSVTGTEVDADGKITNTATLNTGESDTVEVPYVTPTPTPHICGWVYGITKNVTAINGATPATPMPDVTDNDTITYTITVTATCNGTGTCDGTPTDVTLSDPMLWSDPKTVTETDWNGSDGAYTATFTETYSVTGNEVGTDGKITNTATLSTDESDESDTVDVPYVEPTIPPPVHTHSFEYTVEKNPATKAFSEVRERVYFTIVVTATCTDCDGIDAAPSVILVDELVDFEETIEEIAWLPTTTDGVYTYTKLIDNYYATQEDIDEGKVVNTAIIKDAGGNELDEDSAEVPYEEPTTPPHVHAFDYTVTKTAVSAQVNLGEDAEFIITVTATAASDCAGCEITGDEIPKVWLVDKLANLEQWVSFDSAAEENGRWSVTLDVSVTATKVGTITNEVKIYVADDLGDPLGEDEAEVEVNKPETPHVHGYVYTVTKTADKTEVTAEAEVNFTITIKATPYCSEADCDFSWTADTLTVYLEDYIEGQETKLLIYEYVTLAKSEDFEKAITYTLAVGDEDFTNVAKITYEGDKELQDKVGVEVTEGEDPKPPIVTHVHEYGFSITKVAVESEVAAGAAAEFTITVTAIPLACPVDDCDWDGDEKLEVQLVDYIEGNEENPEFDKVVTLTKTGDGEYVYTETYEVETDEDATESYEFKNIAKVFYEDEDEAVAEADDKVEVKAEGTTGPTTPPGTEDNDNGGNETPVTTLRVTPVAVDGGETVTIEEDPIPLVEAAPVNDPEPEEESTSEEIIIEEEEIPLALIDFDEEVVLIEIIEEDIPLAGLPKTSDSMDISSLWALVMLSISGMGLGFIGLKKRDEIID